MSLHEHSSTAVSVLLGLSDDELFAEASGRLSRARSYPESAGQLDAGPMQHMSVPSKGLSALVMRILRRTNSELHAMVCGDADADQEDRQKIRDAFHLGDEAFASALLAAGIGYCGLSPALAVVISVILVKRIGKSAVSELCQAWAESLVG